MLRTHTCGELTKKDLKKEVQLSGWVQVRRDHGGIIFIDLRDRYGLTQVVFDPKHNKQAHQDAEHLGREYVITVTGKVRERLPGMANPKMHTGEIEIIVDALTLLNTSEIPPFEIDEKPTNEDLRLKYRYLDLRRNTMQQRLLIRHQAAQAVRSYLSKQKFMEIETPILVKTTPGGARVFKAPSRIHPGRFYSLPESPQLYKQLLMVAGCDRYFQLARCMRDEDLRQDRQPEFTQIDLEMSFVDQEDIFVIGEHMMKEVFSVVGKTVPKKFQRMSYHEAMSTYGSDKPDLRFDLPLKDVSSVVKHAQFSIFTSVIDKGGVVYCLNAKNCASFSRTDIEQLIELAKTYHLQGLAWMKVTKQGLESSIVKYFPAPVQEQLIKHLDAKEGDLLLFAAEQFEKAVTALGQVRLHLGDKLGLMDKEKLAFCWIVDFPMFEWNEDESKWQAKHHLFTMPQNPDELEKNPANVKGKLYDLVLNGVELGGGSIRIHRRDIQERVLKVIGLEYEEAEKTFDFLLTAFKYGAPPHGGMAIGFDRLVALMCGINDIREVIAFPKNKNMENPMDGSPQPWTDAFMKEMQLKINVVK
ncbi:aspartate--tRNA ligase [Candidatus Woesearchaeota archaeon]|nr:aspartate--tRNA ligase [Candidatus Woesearchaeota archaeon]